MKHGFKEMECGTGAKIINYTIFTKSYSCQNNQNIQTKGGWTHWENGIDSCTRPRPTKGWGVIDDDEIWNLKICRNGEVAKS